IALASPAPDAPPSMKLLFFQGEPQSMRFVSSYSLQEASRGIPRILEFQVIPGDRGKGVRLVVNETLYSGPASAGFFCLGRFLFRPIEVGPRSFVLADKLSYCHFAFQNAPPPPAPGEWRTTWDVDHWPSAIRIDMAPLDDDIIRLRPLPVTAQIH